MATTRTTRGRVPAPAGRLAFPILDFRREPRFVCSGAIEITVDGPDAKTFNAELADISNHGFRILYVGDALPSGSEFFFRHRFFQGRGRVMWTQQTGDRNNGGCLILRD